MKDIKDLTLPTEHLTLKQAYFRKLAVDNGLTIHRGRWTDYV